VRCGVADCCSAVRHACPMLARASALVHAAACVLPLHRRANRRGSGACCRSHRLMPDGTSSIHAPAVVTMSGRRSLSLAPRRRHRGGGPLSFRQVVRVQPDRAGEGGRRGLRRGPHHRVAHQGEVPPLLPRSSARAPPSSPLLLLSPLLRCVLLQPSAVVAPRCCCVLCISIVPATLTADIATMCLIVALHRVFGCCLEPSEVEPPLANLWTLLSWIRRVSAPRSRCISLLPLHT
jgi:hypothetical protein